MALARAASLPGSEPSEPSERVRLHVVSRRLLIQVQSVFSGAVWLGCRLQLQVQSCILWHVMWRVVLGTVS